MNRAVQVLESIGIIMLLSKCESKSKPSSDGVIQSGVYYRGGGNSISSNDLTAHDIIQYEREELGNQDISVEDSSLDLKTIPGRSLLWITFKKRNASEYGKRNYESSIRNTFTNSRNSLLSTKDKCG